MLCSHAIHGQSYPSIIMLLVSTKSTSILDVISCVGLPVPLTLQCASMGVSLNFLRSECSMIVFY